jgi:uncharacterized protein with HEPN domain
MARPLDLIVEEMLDYIEQARSYTQDMTLISILLTQRPNEPSSGASR